MSVLGSANFGSQLTPVICLGVAAVNSLLFGSFALSKKIVSPYPDLSTSQTATAGAMAGAITAVLASPVELFKIKMQGQYGSASDRKLSAVFSETWRKEGFKNGIMRGYWVTVVREIPAYAGALSLQDTPLTCINLKI